MVDLGWDIRPAEAGQINELELMIPSETVRQYMRQTGYVLPDFSRAVLISNSDAPLKIRYWLLERLAAATADEDLKREIDSFLGTQRHDLAAVQDNGGGRYVYTASLRWDTDQDLQPQIFSDFGAALEWGLSCYKGMDFALARELIGSSGSQIMDRSYLAFGPDGRLMESGRTCTDDAGEQRDEPWTFPNAYCDVPNPFDRGDIVWFPRWREYGVIETAAPLPKRGEQKGYCDYSDVQMRVILAGCPSGRPESAGYFGHGHVSPIHMERYEPESWETRNGFDGMLLALHQLCRGEGSVATLRRYAKQLRSYREEMEQQQS